MKTKISILLIALVATFASCTQEAGFSNAKIETEVDSLSYALGMVIGKNLQQDFDEINPAVFAKALQDVANEDTNGIFQDPMIANNFIRAYMDQAQNRAGAENIEKGKTFLAENAAKEGIEVTESGLQYEIIEATTGAKPAAENTVRVHYHGTTIDGTVFDSSVERGEPAEFPLNGVIKGWTEGLQLMSVGSKYKFYIPSDLAYGPNGAGGVIGPNETLIFDVELLEIVK